MWLVIVNNLLKNCPTPQSHKPQYPSVWNWHPWATKTNLRHTHQTWCWISAFVHFFSFFYKKIFHNHSFKSFDMGVLDGHRVTFSTGKLHFRISMWVVLTFSAKVLVFKVLTVLQVNSWWPPPRECKTAKRTKSPYLESKTTNRTEIFQWHVFMIKNYQDRSIFTRACILGYADPSIQEEKEK